MTFCEGGSYVNKGSAINISAVPINTNISPDVSGHNSPDLKLTEKLKALEEDLAAAMERIATLETENQELKTVNGQLQEQLQNQANEISNLQSQNVQGETDQVEDNTQVEETAPVEDVAQNE